MRLSLVGFDSDDIKRLQKAVAFFGGLLFEPKLKKQVAVQVQRDPNLQEEGECWPEDDKYRNFVISIRPCFDDWMKGLEDDPVSVVAHEMVHCWQWATHQLTCPMKVFKDLSTGEDRVRYEIAWNGVVWTPRPREVEAYDSPWELDAYGREQGLYRRWMMIESGKIHVR